MFATNSFVGNLGAPLHVGEEDMEEDKHEEIELEEILQEGGEQELQEQICIHHEEPGADAIHVWSTELHLWIWRFVVFFLQELKLYWHLMMKLALCSNSVQKSESEGVMLDIFMFLFIIYIYLSMYLMSMILAMVNRHHFVKTQ